MKVSTEPNPKRDMLTALQQGGKLRVPIVLVVMMGGPLDGKTFAIDPDANEMELTPPADAYNAVSEGRAPKLVGLYKRFGTSMIWQKEFDDVFNQVQQVPREKLDAEGGRDVRSIGCFSGDPMQRDDAKD